jgi:hypothetical protein
VTVSADADSWINQSNPSENKGTDSILKLHAKSGNNNVRALVRFAMPASVPAGCVIQSATLRLYAASWKTGRTLQALQINAGWTESAVTWGNQPATTGAAATTSSGSGYLQWNVTTHVQAMYNAGANHGFLIRDASENSGDKEQQFHSREKGETMPELVITFASGSAMQTSAFTVTSINTGPIQMLASSGFEGDPNGWKVPTGWTNVGPLQGDKVRCNTQTETFAHTGSCAYQFKGRPGEISKLTSPVPFKSYGLMAGDKLGLSAFIDQQTGKANAVVVVLKVVYKDPNLAPEKLKIRLSETAQAGFVEMTAGKDITLLGDVKKIKVSVQYAAGSGKFVVDDVSVSLMRVTSSASVFLLIDEDAIDSGIKSIEIISFNAPHCGGGDPAVCVNEPLANPGVRVPLFTQGTDITPYSGLMLPTGQVGDEGLFRFSLPDPQVSLQNGASFTTAEFIAAAGAAADENNLDKIGGVQPLSAADIDGLVGRTVCAVVYDSDISASVSDGYGSLKGATLGVTAFVVTAVTPNLAGGSYLPDITVNLLSSQEIASACPQAAGANAVPSVPDQLIPLPAPPDLVPLPAAPDDLRGSN